MADAPILGAHRSIADGYYNANEAAGKFGMNCCQVFMSTGIPLVQTR